jgi:hypothetical protein
MWPAVLLEHPAVCEDPAVLLRLLATSRALGGEAAAAAAGRLRLTLGRERPVDYDPYDPSDNDDGSDDEERDGDSDGSVEEVRDGPKDRARRQLCAAQAAFVERRGALLAELVVADWGEWRGADAKDHRDRPIERVLAPALRRAAAAGRLRGLRALAAPGFALDSKGGLLRALAPCTALTRLRLGTFGYPEYPGPSHSVYAGPAKRQLRAVGGWLAALRGLRELDLAFGCEVGR